jgi:hypothetical protein
MYIICMGTIFQFRSIKIVIRTRDHNPPHAHVIRGDCEAKVELLTQKVIHSHGFSANDLRRIVSFMKERQDLLMEAWNEIHEENTEN